MAYPGARQKRTTKVEFERCLHDWKPGVDASKAARTAEEITRRRERLLEILSDQDASSMDAIEALRQYLEMPVKQLINMANGTANIRFYWLNTVGSEVTVHFDDAIFDFSSIMMKTALWMKEQGIIVLADPENLLWAAAIFDCMLELNLNGSSPDLHRQNVRALSVQCSGEALLMRCRDNLEFLSPSQCRDIAILAAERFEETLNIIDGQTESGKKWKEFVKFKYNLCYALARTFQSKLLSEKLRHEEAMSAVKHAKYHMRLAKEKAEGFDVFDPATVITLSRGEEFRRIDFLVEKRIQECEKISGLKVTDDEASPLQLGPNWEELVDQRVFQLPPKQYNTWLGDISNGISTPDGIPSADESGFEEPSCCIVCLSECIALPRRFVRWMFGKSDDEETQMIALEQKQYGSSAGE